MAAKTVISGDESYCTPTQFGQRYDVRSLAQRLSDNGEDVQDALADDKLEAILMQASGRVEMACSVGEKYTPADLTALAASETNMAETLAGLVADLAIPIIFRRRPEILAQFPQVQEANNVLAALAEGSAAIFGFQETMDAGHMDSHYEEPDDIANRNLFTYQARRFFGTRGNRQPRGIGESA